jgi:hypothetical protein
MRVDTSLADSISAATKSAKTASHPSTHKSSSSGQSSFKSVLKAAASTTDTSAPSTQAAVAETTQAVPGHYGYAEILTGPRAGMYVNTTHNKRAGQAFVLVERNGVEYHIYGTGKDRTVVEMKRHTPAPAATSPTTTSGSVTPDTGTATPTPSTPATTGKTPTGGTVTAGKITTDTATL